MLLVHLLLPIEATLALQGESVLHLSPQLLVDQGLLAAVEACPGGDPLSAQRTAQRGLVHRLEETRLTIRYVIIVCCHSIVFMVCSNSMVIIVRSFSMPIRTLLPYGYYGT